MDRSARLLVVFSVTLATFLGCAQKEKSQEEKAVALGQWQYNMLSLSETLSRLMPKVVSAREFNDPKNFAEIEKDTRQLAGIAHKVNQMQNKPSEDPSLNFVSGKFASDMNEAVRQLEINNRKFARFLIRNSTSYCIACHTRNDQGRQDLHLSLNANLSGLQPLERAEYHMAVRDFEEALKDFSKIMNSSDAQIESPQSLEVAAEKSLAVAVRVKRDPVLAMKSVTDILEGKWAPIYLKLNAMAWKTAVEEWKKESPKATSKNPVAQLERAKYFLQRGWKFSASTPQSRAGLVYFLRASTILHDVLSQSNSPVYSDALYYAGLAAESLRDLNLWTLHDTYFEACIRSKPYSAIAKKCYLRFEALQLSQYSDGEQSQIPAHVRDHLRELRALAVKEDGDFLNWGFIE